MAMKDIWWLVLSRVIFSLYIDIQKPVSHFENKDKFNQNYSWLLERQQQYAEHCGVEYKHFTYDDDYIEFDALAEGYTKGALPADYKTSKPTGTYYIPGEMLVVEVVAGEVKSRKSYKDSGVS